MKRIFVAAAALLVLVSSAHAQDRWDRKKGDCEDVFRGWRNTSLNRLTDCVMTWEMHRDAAAVDGDWRAIVHGAFDRLYQEGDKRQAHMALSALKRLSLRPKSLRDDARPQDRSRPAVVETDPEPMIDPQRARALYSRGVKSLRKNDVPGALADFLDAADSDPSYAQPLYRAAQCYVRLRKAEPAIATLERMKAIDSDVSATLIDRARTDDAFGPIQNKAGFKALTGLATVQILNAGGAKGRKTVANYRTMLEDGGIAVASVADDARPRQNTYIFTRPGFERQGEDIRRRLRLGLIHKRPIDWNTPYDVILVHGERVESAWVDDEAEKAGKAAADKKKAEKAKAKKAADDKKKAKADMKKKLEMLKMMEELEAEDAAGAADPTGGSGDPIDAL